MLAHQAFTNVVREPVPPEVHPPGRVALGMGGVRAVPFQLKSHIGHTIYRNTGHVNLPVGRLRYSSGGNLTILAGRNNVNRLTGE